jgi:hypothetical protein
MRFSFSSYKRFSLAFSGTITRIAPRRDPPEQDLSFSPFIAVIVDPENGLLHVFC